MVVNRQFSCKDISRPGKQGTTGYRLLFRFCIPSSPVELIVPVIYKENMKVCMSDLRVFGFCFLYKLLFLVQTQP